MHNPQDMTPTQRSSYITRLLLLGWEPTTAEAARRLGMTPQGAARLLGQLSLTLPLYVDGHYGGRWRLDKTTLSRWVREHRPQPKCNGPFQ